jgi:hypothetical protein
MTVIRTAEVRLKLVQEKAQLESPGSGVSNAYKDLQKSAAESAGAVREVAAASKEVAKDAPQHRRAVDSMAAGMKQLGEEWRKAGSGRDSWKEGLGRMQEQRQAAIDAEKKAADERRKAIDEAARAQEEAVRQQAAATQQMLAHFREGGEGALRMARGIAFLSASGSEDLKKLVQTVAVAQGAFDVFAGGFKMFSNISAAFGPVGVAVAGLTTALGLGAAAWNKYARETEEATKRLEENRKKNAELLAQERDRQAGLRAARGGLELQVMERLLGATTAPGARERQLRDNQQRLQGITGQGEAAVEDYVRRFSAVPAQQEVRRELERRERSLLSAVDARAETEREIHAIEQQRIQSFGATNLFGVAAGGGPLGLPGVAASVAGASVVSDEFQRTLNERNQQFDQAQRELIEIFRRTTDRLLQIENAANGGG